MNRTFEILRLASQDHHPQDRPAVVVGNFDGVHRGHQALVGAALGAAAATPGSAGVVALTFEPHPARVLSPDRAPASLMTLQEKARALEALGVLRLAVLEFTEDVSHWTPEAFAQRVLADSLGAAVVVVGRHFRFGRGRSGDIATLERLGAGLGFQVLGLDPLLHEGTPVSSTRIRQALARGAVEGARALLGRRFAISGEVVRGEGRGRRLGIPTANLQVLGETIPGRGVYACWCAIEIDDLRSASASPGRRLGVNPPATPLRERSASIEYGPLHPAVVNIGRRPTFEGTGTTVEAHLPGFDADLYGRNVRLEFEVRLREERPFPGAEALVQQIRSDIEEARGLLIAPS